MSASPLFVARERELARLDGFLNRAMAQQAQVCLVSGEAGSGKTALVTEFARRAQEQYQDLLVAVGQSDALIGVGDPYLPFREILGMLTGDVESTLARGRTTRKNAERLKGFLRLSVEMLVGHGPDLIDLFVPGSALVAKIGVSLASQVGWVDQLRKQVARQSDTAATLRAGVKQDQIFEQYTNVLKAMAGQQPLLLVVDDLHWADASSIGLLFHLGRRLEKNRIMLLGTYRPDEVAVGRSGERHPLEKVLAEFKRYFGDVGVELDQVGEAERRAFVDAVLAGEPNRLDEAFRQALFDHTGGQALFTIELLRAMQERGDLVKDAAGRWVEGPGLRWDTLPPRVEGVIEERIGRLEEGHRETLSVAGVEGESFTAEVVARARSVGMLELSRDLSEELARKHRLVHAVGVRHVGARRLSLFRFHHQLIQQYLYDNLSDVERAYLHETIGNTLEELYADQAIEISERLAWHFSEAGVQDKAVHYLHQAGKRAAARYSHTEAVDYLTRALDLTAEQDAAGRWRILSDRVRVYGFVGDHEHQARDLSALAELADVLDDDRLRMELALHQAGFAAATDDYATLVDAAERAIGLAQAVQDRSGQARAAFELAWGLMGQGNYPEARRRAEEALQCAREVGSRQLEFDALNALHGITSRQGEWPVARDYGDQCLRAARDIGDVRLEAAAVGNLSLLLADQFDLSGALAAGERALQLDRQIGNRRGVANKLDSIGVVYLQLGAYARAAACFTECLEIQRETNTSEIYVIINLGSLCNQLGNFQAAHSYGQKAIGLAQELNSDFLNGYALMVVGDSLLGQGRLSEAAAAFEQATALRRAMKLDHLVMESLAGSARVLQAQGELKLALAHVEEILDRLREGALDGTEDPVKIYLTCCRVLRACGDARIAEVLAAAYELLQQQAAKITDAAFRRSFLTNVPSNREIARAWQAHAPDAAVPPGSEARG